MLKKLTLMAMAIILTLASLSTNANAFLYNDGINHGVATVIETTGTEPDGYCKTYSVTTGDDLTYSIILNNLVDPDRLTITMPDGLDFHQITDSTIFGTNSFRTLDWNVANHVIQTENFIQIDLSDLPEQTNQVTIQFTCSTNQNVSPYGTAPEIVLTDKNQTNYIIETRKVHGLMMQVKTLDGKQILKNGEFELYKDAKMTTPVTFEYSDNTYIATKLDDADTTTTLTNQTGVITLRNLREGTYYLKQIKAPDEHALFETSFEIKVTGEYKFDPNDPANKTENDSKLVAINPFKNFDKTDSEKRKENAIKERQRRENMKAAAEYHATHPKEIISTVTLGTKMPNTISTKNTDRYASVILDYDAPLNIIRILQNATTFTICAGIGGYCVRKLYDKRTKSRSGKSEKS